PRALQRPFGFVAPGNPVRPADRQRDRTLLLPAVVLALQEVIEEALLQRDRFRRVERRMVVAGVDAQPFLLAAGGKIALDIAAPMQPLAAPIADGQYRNLDARSDRRALAIGSGVVRLVALNLGRGARVEVEQVRRQGFAGGLLAAQRVDIGRVGIAVLIDEDLAGEPQLLKLGAGDPAVVGDVAVMVERAFPRDDRSQTFGLP